MSSAAQVDSEHCSAFKELARLSGFVDIKPSVLDALVELLLLGRSASQLIILLNSLMVGAPAPRTNSNATKPAV